MNIHGKISRWAALWATVIGLLPAQVSLGQGTERLRYGNTNKPECAAVQIKRRPTRCPGDTYFRRQPGHCRHSHSTLDPTLCIGQGLGNDKRSTLGSGRSPDRHRQCRSNP